MRRLLTLVIVFIAVGLGGAGVYFEEPQSRDQLTARFREILLSAAQADLAWVEAGDSLAAGEVSTAELDHVLPPDDEIVVISLNHGQFDQAFGGSLDAGEKRVLRIVMAAGEAEAIVERFGLPAVRIERTGKRLRPFIEDKLPREPQGE